MAWHVLQSADGRYSGTTWELFNNSARRPREASVELQEARLYPSRDAAEADRARVASITGADCRPVPVEIEGAGKNARIVMGRDRDRQATQPLNERAT